MTVLDIYQLLDQLAPFDTQEGFDNSGLLAGDPAWPVTGIHLALDCTPAVVEEAVRLGANLIISHHPLMFSPIQSLREDQPEAALLCSLIRHRIALISAHTCLDKAPGGINDVLACTLGLTDITGEGFLRVGNLPQAMTADEAGEYFSQRLSATVRVMGQGTVHRIGLCSGAGSEEWVQAAACGADGFVSGEIRHHHALAAAAQGVICFECGHHATEEPGIFALADALQKGPDGVKLSLRITRSQIKAYC